MTNRIELSVIVPVTYGQQDSTAAATEVAALAKDYLAGLDSVGKSFEILFIVDGDKPETFDALSQLALTEQRIRILKFAKAFGDATAIVAGFRNSSGEIILTLPASPQVSSQAIPDLVAGLENTDMAVACRSDRVSGTSDRSKNWRRRGFHWLVRILSGERYSDLGCAARAFSRKILEEIPLYGAHHIFLPLLAAKQGFRVTEVVVKVHDSKPKSGGYNAKFYLQRILDIFTVVFLVRFTKKPIRFFGMIGSVTFIFGMTVLSYVIFQRLFFGTPLADRPALLVSSLFTVLGLQVFALGLLGELIIFTHAKDLKEYTIEKVIN